MNRSNKSNKNLMFLTSKTTIFTILLLLLIAFYDISIVKDNFESEFTSLITFFFGGINFNNPRPVLITQYVLVMSLFINLLLDYLELSRDRDYLIILRHRGVGKFVLSKLWMLIIFAVMFFLLLNCIYLIIGGLLLKHSSAYCIYLQEILDRSIHLDWRRILAMEVLYLINLINAGLLSLLIKLKTKRTHLALLFTLSIILMSIFSSGTFLRWSPLSVSMIVRFDTITGLHNGIAIIPALAICLCSIAILLMLIKLITKKIEIL